MGRVLAAVLASSLLAAAYARGAWPLGFVMLLPWLVALDGLRGVRATLAAALAMSVAFVAAAFGWFAPAVADYTGMPAAGALAALLVAAPLLHPQFLAFALVRRLAGSHPPVLRAGLAIAAWLATEWAAPRLFGDTLGHGLQPARLLRQGADVAGAMGLTLVLLACNEALAQAIARRGRPARELARPLGFALALPALLAGYGAFRVATLPGDGGAPPLRIGLVQAAIVDYERLRRERGAYAVVREVLDTHYALSTDLRARGADALVWPETVYPTTFAQPRSDAGAELDREIVDFTRRAGVSLVFGTYARDDDGEYVVAAFVDPARGPLGVYRKTRLFPLTEHVPRMLDGPVLRRHLPWAGTWRPGDGARVFPLFTADGREVPVAPLICRDDVDPRLARDGARLGAQLLVGLSNDAWFTRAPLGARLHLAAAAFRSIETRLPQVRATTNGLSAVVDPTGEVTARTAMGTRETLLAEVVPRPAGATLAMHWGDWLGPLSALSLAGYVFLRLLRGRGGRPERVDASPEPAAWRAGRHRVLLLRPWQRVAIAALRAFARAAVLVLGLLAVLDDGPPRMLAQIRTFAAWVLAPEVAAALLAAGCRAWLEVDGPRLVLTTARRRIEIERSRIAALRPWRWPWPRSGFDLRMDTGGTWERGIALHGATLAVRSIGVGDAAADAPVGVPDAAASRLPAGDPFKSGSVDASAAMTGSGTARIGPATSDADDGIASPRAPRIERLRDLYDLPPRRLDHPLWKFVLFPLVPALPAFRLHQVIAYGGPFGEYHTFGLQAWLGGLLLWWASWAVSLVLVAGALRAVAEIGGSAALLLRPERARSVRQCLLDGARIAYFAGVPAWLVARLLLA